MVVFLFHCVHVTVFMFMIIFNDIDNDYSIKAIIITENGNIFVILSDIMANKCMVSTEI